MKTESLATTNLNSYEGKNTHASIAQSVEQQFCTKKYKLSFFKDHVRLTKNGQVIEEYYRPLPTAQEILEGLE